MGSIEISEVNGRAVYKPEHAAACLAQIRSNGCMKVQQWDAMFCAGFVSPSVENGESCMGNYKCIRELGSRVTGIRRSLGNHRRKL